MTRLSISGITTYHPRPYSLAGHPRYYHAVVYESPDAAYVRPPSPSEPPPLSLPPTQLPTPAPASGAIYHLCISVRHVSISHCIPRIVQLPNSASTRTQPTPRTRPRPPSSYCFSRSSVSSPSCLAIFDDSDGVGLHLGSPFCPLQVRFIYFLPRPQGLTCGRLCAAVIYIDRSRFAAFPCHGRCRYSPTTIRPPLHPVPILTIGRARRPKVCLHTLAPQPAFSHICMSSHPPSTHAFVCNSLSGLHTYFFAHRLHLHLLGLLLYRSSSLSAALLSPLDPHRLRLFYISLVSAFSVITSRLASVPV